jgi:hypothetical protein
MRIRLPCWVGVGVGVGRFEEDDGVKWCGSGSGRGGGIVGV